MGYRSDPVDAIIAESGGALPPWSSFQALLAVRGAGA